MVRRIASFDEQPLTQEEILLYEVAIPEVVCTNEVPTPKVNDVEKLSIKYLEI